MRVVSVSHLFYKKQFRPVPCHIENWKSRKGGFVNVILVKEVEVILIELWDDRIVHS